MNPLWLKHLVKVSFIRVYNEELSPGEGSEDIKDALKQFEKDIAEAMKRVDDTTHRLHEGIINVNDAVTELLGE